MIMVFVLAMVRTEDLILSAAIRNRIPAFQAILPLVFFFLAHDLPPS
jgi:hypothetical protein